MKTVILCGGAGTRLWPVSRKTNPKQFAKIIDNESLYQKTIKRNESFSDEIKVIVNEKQFPICKEQSESSSSLQFLLEPVGRNTAPAIALACLEADPDDILLIVPSDHLIGDKKKYDECVLIAKELAETGNLVTFGIEAKYPETGYGYIEASGNDVISFKEKPDLETAKRYISNGNYFWNSGMFCFKAKTFLDELAKSAPKILEQIKIVHQNKFQKDNAITFDLDKMMNVPDDSIDYAVMENSSIVKVVPSNFQWSDMGSYDSLYDELSKDSDQNASSGETISYNSKNNLIIAKKLVTTFDVEDLIIVDTEDALLIGKKGQSQDVKKIVDILKERNSKLLD